MSDTFFSRQPAEVARDLASAAHEVLHESDAIVLFQDQNDAQALTVLTKLALPTVQMIFSARAYSLQFVQGDPGFNELLWAHAQIRTKIPAPPAPAVSAGAALTKEQSDQVLAEMANSVLERAVSSTLLKVDGRGVVLAGETTATAAARSIVNRIQQSMQERYVTVRHSDSKAKLVDTFFKTDSNGKKREQITQEEYQRLINSPQFEIDKSGVSEDGDVYFLTKGGIVLVRPKDEEIDEYDGEDPPDDLWEDLASFNASAEDVEDVRNFLALGAAIRVPGRVQSIDTVGLVTLVTPNYVTLRTQQEGEKSIRTDQILGMSVAQSVGFSFLPVSSEIVGEVVARLEARLRGAFVPSQAQKKQAARPR